MNETKIKNMILNKKQNNVKIETLNIDVSNGIKIEYETIKPNCKFNEYFKTFKTFQKYY